MFWVGFESVLGWKYLWDLATLFYFSNIVNDFQCIDRTVKTIRRKKEVMQLWNSMRRMREFCQCVCVSSGHKHF